MSSNLLVERALSLVPDSEEFLPFTDAVVGTSRVDQQKRWDRSSAYATLGKRLVDPERLAEAIPQLTARIQEHLAQLYTLVLGAIRQQQTGDLAAAAGMLIRAGELEEGQRRLVKAERLYEQALEIARDLHDRGPQILGLRRMGRICRTAGKLDDAWSWYEKSYALAGDALDRSGQAIACQGLGNLCDDRGRREDSRSWFERGLRIAADLDDPGLVWPFYTNLSVVARKEGDLDEAEALLIHAGEQIEAAGSEQGMWFWYNSKGLLLLARDDPAGAEAVYREGLLRSGDAFWEMTLRINLGHSLIPQARLFEATEEARCAEEIAIFNRFIPDLVDVYMLLGSIARAECDEEGFVFYEQALEVVRERGLPLVRKAEVYHDYARLLLDCGEASQAAACLEQARRVYERLGLSQELKEIAAVAARVASSAEPPAA